jgi:uncharacterized repeat protein (TIGR01451 family)
MDQIVGAMRGRSLRWRMRRARVLPLLLALAVAVPAALVALVATPRAASAAPQNVTVRVTVDKISAIDCFEGTDPLFGNCLGAADFYAIVTVDGNELPRQGPIADQNNADPDPDWVFDRSVDVTRGRVPVSIEVRDDDGGLRFGDDHADIDSTNGGDPFNLDFQVNLAPCAVSGDGSPQCERFTSSAGTADNHKARIFYKVEVLDSDNDNDSLPDGWETRGLDTNGDGAVDVDLAAMGADPNRQDLFVEIDCLAASTHNHCPQKEAIGDVVKAFADDPRANPDGTTGVQLHVDTGSFDGANAVTKVKGAGGVTGAYGDIGAAAGDKAAGRGGDQIPETAANQIIDWDGPAGDPATSFFAIKGQSFDARRAAAFRYALFGHQTNARAAANDCTGGWAEGIPANDFMVTLGGGRDTNGDGTADQPCWGNAGNGLDDDGDGKVDEDGYDGIDNDGDCPAGNDANGDGTVCGHGDFKVDEDGGDSLGTRSEQAGAFMHELGHTLGLGHGGADGVNGKPNYLSVMNYAFQSCKVPARAGKLPGGCDYSRDDLADLVEPKDADNAGLDECKGFDGGLYGFGVSDWNNNKVNEGVTCAEPNQTNVQRDVNDDGALTTLQGSDDWGKLKYKFRDLDTYEDGTAHPPATHADPGTIERAQAYLSRLLRPDVSVDKSGPADTTPGATLAYSLDVRNGGSGPAFSVTLVDTRPDGSTAPFDLDLLTVGSKASRAVSYTVPCTAADGSVLTNTATVSAVDLVGFAETSTANNRDSVSTSVHAPVLTLSKTATPAVNAGEAISYRLTYENTGSGDARSVVLTDTLPTDVYYSAALDQGAGPKPDAVNRNADGTTTLTWNVGTLAAGSGPQSIEYTARPSLLSLGGGSVQNGATLTFTNENGCAYAPVTAARSTAITTVPPTRDPLSMGYWKTHPNEWTSEILARIQATDQRFDGADASPPDELLSPAEVNAVLGAGGTTPNVLRSQLLATYLNLATRRINAGTAIASKTDSRLGLRNVREAALYGIATLRLPLAGNANRYSDATTVLDEINLNKSERY